jgi:hypothetical protein
MTDFDIHERTRIRIHVISGKVAPVEEIRAEIDDILTRYMAYCEASGITPDDYTLERGEIARGA